MQKLKFGLALILGFTILACQQDDEASPKEKSKEDECLTVRASNHGEVVQGRYIAAFQKEESNGGRKEPKAARVFQRYRLPAEKIERSFEGEYSSYVLRLTPEEALQLKNDSEVTMLEPERIVSICACFTVVEPRLVPWNINKVGYDDGTGKTAWIIDTGIDLDHPDLNVDTQRSRSFIRDVVSANDENGHGTHIAGVIGALNNHEGTLGVASGASLVGLKALDGDGQGLLSNVLNALAYVRANGKAGDVVNISLGLSEISDLLEKEIKAIADRGIYVAIAAGNDSKPAREFSPAHASGDNIFTISAVDSLDQFANFSNYGNDVVDFAAPGVRIYSTYKNGKYAVMSGTSMATPHVAGLLLITSGKPNTAGSALNDPDGTSDPIAHR